MAVQAQHADHQQDFFVSFQSGARRIARSPFANFFFVFVVDVVVHAQLPAHKAQSPSISETDMFGSPTLPTMP